MKLNEIAFILFFGSMSCVLGQMLVGRPDEVDVNSPEIIRLTRSALEKLNQGLCGDETYQLQKILKATQQTVAGIKTELTLLLFHEQNLKICTVVVWEQKWLNKMEVALEKCLPYLKNPAFKRSVDVDNVSKQDDTNIRLFNKFLKTHSKTYSDGAEYKKRFRIFRANLNKIKLLRKSEQGTAQYGLTWFSDLTAKEFKRYLGLKAPQITDDLPLAEIPNVELPDQFDWRHYNVVTPVKNQKFCGSCWAFSVTGNVEGQWALKRGELLSLSEQELVDCDTTDDGCEGGYMTNAYKAIVRLGGLEPESDYPYEAKDDACRFNGSEARVRISGGVNITGGEFEMAKWLVKNGPISIGLNGDAMQFYFGGISHPLKWFCDRTNLNHGVLLVGFGVHHSSIFNKTIPYWIIKNSWGSRWGERGYYRLYRGDGSCGVDRMASSATIK